MSLQVSKNGQKLLKQARAGVSDSQWCRQASMILHPDRSWQEGDPPASGCSLTTLKNFLAGKKINEATFRAFCEVVGINWQDVAQINPISQEKTQFIQNFWVGRQSLVTELVERLQEFPLIVLTGITGIGKTALAYQLGKVALQYQCLRPINLEDTPNDFTNVMTSLLISLNVSVTLKERKNPRVLLQKLLDHTRDRNYFLQFDSLEVLLSGDEATGWNNFSDPLWLEFFQIFLNNNSQTRIVVTSQDFPNELQELGISNRFYCKLLLGLNSYERLELFDKLFARAGQTIDMSSANRILLERIGAVYEGHPLALLVIAGEICTDEFQGNVAAYWQKYGSEIEELEKARQREELTSKDDRLRLHRFSRRLKEIVKQKIDACLDRLEQDFYDAYLLLCNASIYRRPVPRQAFFFLFKEWLKFTDIRLLVALGALEDRYLIETELLSGIEEIRLHNLIRSAVLPRTRKEKVQIP